MKLAALAVIAVIANLAFWAAAIWILLTLLRHFGVIA